MAGLSVHDHGPKRNKEHALRLSAWRATILLTATADQIVMGLRDSHDVRAARSYSVLHVRGASLAPYLSWRSSRMSASAVMSASSKAPCRSSRSLELSAS